MRSFLRLFCAVVLLASMMSTALRAQNLTHGPVVGAVTGTSASFVYRVDGPATLAMQLSTDPAFASPLISSSAPAVADSDFFAMMSIEGLTAGTLYYYRPVINGAPWADSITRSFRTFPTPQSDADYVFLTGSCQQAPSFDPNSRIGHIFEDMAEESGALFLLQNGDWTYPDTTDSEVGSPWDFWPLDYDRIQSSYRSRYAPDYPMINLLRRMPVAYTFDDHDMIDDNSDHFNYPWAGIRNSIRGEQYLFPSYPLANPEGGVWQSFRCGSAEYFLTDNHAQRSPNLMGFSFSVVGAETTWTFDPPPEKLILDGNPFLDPDQMDWLEGQLLNSTATWKFISTGTMFNPGIRGVLELALMLQNSAYDPVYFPGYDQYMPLYTIAIEFADKWAGFPESIRRLVCFVREHNIQNVILLTGDSHNSAIDDGANSLFPELMSSGLDITNSQEVNIFEQFGIFIWNQGGHVGGLPPEAYGNSYGRVNVFGRDSVKLEVVAEGGEVLGAHTVLPGYLPDDVNIMAAPYGLDFGSVLLCRTPAVQAFITLSTSCGTLHVLDIVSTDPHFMVMPGFPTSFSLESGQKMIVPVLYFPSAAEVNQGALVVISNDPQAPTLVYLQGQGIAPDTCQIPAGIYRTETHGSWGQDCHGNNVGCLRDAYFTSAFPNGLVVGGNHTLTLTTSQSVADLLPTGGRAGSLTRDYLNPTATSAGNFAGKVVALAINVAFGNSGVAGFADLGSLIIAYGPFMNYTVDELLALANSALGGDLSGLPVNATLEQLSAAVASVNSNFTGRGSSGYLLDPCCEPAARALADAQKTDAHPAPSAKDDALCLSNYPNPFNPMTEIAFTLQEGGFARLTVYNVLGQQVTTLVNRHLSAGRYVAAFDGTDLPSGLYLYRLEAGGQTLNRKMLLIK